MAGKNAEIRLYAIDRALRKGGDECSWQNLAKKCNKMVRKMIGIERKYSRRTIMDDIRTMREVFQSPISYSKQAKSYYYEDENYYLFNIDQQHKKDTAHLQQALLSLRQFRNYPQFQGLEDHLIYLENRAKSALTPKSAAKSKKQKPPFISFDKNKELKGLHLLPRIYEWTRDQKCLEVQYKPFREPVQFMAFFHPHHIREYNNRWFLLGFAGNDGQIINLALDRIQKIEENGASFRLQTSFDAESYFEHLVGVSHDSNRKCKVVLRFFQGRGNYVKTKKIHPSQCIRSENKSCLEIELHLIPNRELETLILSFGDHVKIQQPKSLRKRVAQRLKDAAQLY